MQYTSAPESAESANAWLDSHHRRFGFFIDNEWLKPEERATASSTQPSNGALLAQSLQAEAEDVDNAVAAARRAQQKWWELGPHARSRHLYSLTRHMQKHSRLLATVESLDNGKTIRETRDADIPLAIRHFYSHAGWAQVRLVAYLESRWKPNAATGSCCWRVWVFGRSCLTQRWLAMSRWVWWAKSFLGIFRC